MAALEGFFEHMPAAPGSAFVVITHQAARQQSLLAELLSRKTEMPVVEVAKATLVEPDHVYTVKPGFILAILGGMLQPMELGPAETSRMPVDYLFPFPGQRSAGARDRYRALGHRHRRSHRYQRDQGRTRHGDVFEQDCDLRFSWACGRVFGRPPGELIGKSDAEVLEPDDVQRLGALKREVIASGAALGVPVDLTVQGQRRRYHFYIAPSRDPGGNTVGVSCLATDTSS